MCHPRAWCARSTSPTSRKILSPTLVGTHPNPSPLGSHLTPPTASPQTPCTPSSLPPSRAPFFSLQGTFLFILRRRIINFFFPLGLSNNRQPPPKPKISWRPTSHPLSPSHLCRAAKQPRARTRNENTARDAPNVLRFSPAMLSCATGSLLNPGALPCPYLFVASFSCMYLLYL